MSHDTYNIFEFYDKIIHIEYEWLEEQSNLLYYPYILIDYFLCDSKPTMPHVICVANANGQL